MPLSPSLFLYKIGNNWKNIVIVWNHHQSDNEIIISLRCLYAIVSLANVFVQRMFDDMDYESVIRNTITTLMGGLGVVNNSLIVLALVRNPKHLKRHCNTLIMFLALADTVIGIGTVYHGIVNVCLAVMTYMGTLPPLTKAFCIAHSYLSIMGEF